MASVPLIPRQILFGNPDRESVQISPDGVHVAYLSPWDGVLNVWVAPRDHLDAAQAITHDIGRGIRFYIWAYTNRHLSIKPDMAYLRTVAAGEFHLASRTLDDQTW